MHTYSVYIIIIFFLIRVYSLIISVRNEKRLKNSNAVEYGIKNSKLLALTHILIYITATVEAYFYGGKWTAWNTLGLLMMIVGYIVLFVVIKTLGQIWTLKLYILPEHPIVNFGLYKITKHPNYYLNIIPELIGVLLMTSSYLTWILLIPYAYFLYRRIEQEESVMNLYCTQ